MHKTPEEIREIHDIEQISAGLRVIAALTHAYYTRLKEEGFDSEQAMELTGFYQCHLFGSLESDEDDGV